MIDLTESAKSALKETAGRDNAHLMDAEFELAWQTAVADFNGDSSKVEHAIQAAITAWRKPFEGQGGAISHAAQDWRAIYQKSNDAAKANLPENSSDASELTVLRQQQAEITRKLEAKQAALDRALAEYHSIPGEVQKLKEQLENIAKWRRELDCDALKAAYKSAFDE